MAENLIVNCAVSALRFVVDVAFQMSTGTAIDISNHLFILFSRFRWNSSRHIQSARSLALERAGVGGGWVGVRRSTLIGSTRNECKDIFTRLALHRSVARRAVFFGEFHRKIFARFDVDRPMDELVDVVPHATRRTQRW